MKKTQSLSVLLFPLCMSACFLQGNKSPDVATPSSSSLLQSSSSVLGSQSIQGGSISSGSISSQTPLSSSSNPSGVISSSSSVVSYSSDFVMTVKRKVLKVDAVNSLISTQQVKYSCENGLAVADTLNETSSYVVKNGLIATFDSTDNCTVALKTSSMNILGVHSSSAPFSYMDRQGNLCQNVEDTLLANAATSTSVEVTPTLMTQTTSINLARFCPADAILSGSSGANFERVDCNTVKFPQAPTPNLYIKMEYLNNSTYNLKITIFTPTSSCTAIENGPLPGTVLTDAYCAAQPKVSATTACMQKVVGSNSTAENSNVVRSLARRLIP